MPRRLPLAIVASAIAICAALVVPGAASAGGAAAKPRAPHENGALRGVINQFPIDRGQGRATKDWTPRTTSKKYAGPTRGTRTQSRSIGGGTTTPPAASTLVLFDSTGPYSWLGELYGTASSNLVGHFGTFKAKPVTAYTAGELNAYTAAVYVGSTYDEPIPTAFLDDVLANTRPVLWIDNNIWELVQRAGTGATSFASTYGFAPWVFDNSTVGEVRYKGTSLTRYAPNAAGIMSYSSFDATIATSLADAVRADGTTLPWAVRGRNLTYIGENPFAYISENDRYLAVADLLFDVLAPSTPTRHRALARIEDIGPDADPADLRAIADYFGSQGVPFSFIVYPVYRDPRGVANGGVDTTIRLKDRPEVVSALKYMVKKGGTMVMHGYTHQYGNTANPYDGLSGNDFEFFLAHVDAEDHVVMDGPVPEDSQSWAADRITKSFGEFKAAGLANPTIFEFPHYAGSAADYAAVKARFSSRYERSLYFNGVLTGTTVDSSRWLGQFFPYKVTDVYGSTVIPENLGNYEPEPYNQHPVRLPADIIATAQRNLVVRDGMASFFYHPFLGVDGLREIVTGIKAAGYTFVRPTDL